MRESAYRKKKSESTEQTDSGNVEVNLEEEDLVVANIDEESQGEGKKNDFIQIGVRLIGLSKLPVSVDVCVFVFLCLFMSAL